MRWLIVDFSKKPRFLNIPVNEIVILQTTHTKKTPINKPPVYVESYRLYLLVMIKWVMPVLRYSYIPLDQRSINDETNELKYTYI